MASKDEVQADLTAIRAKVTATRGAAQSAIQYIRDLIDRIMNSAASATDLDEFRAELALINEETQATENELRAAISSNP